MKSWSFRRLLLWVAFGLMIALLPVTAIAIRGAVAISRFDADKPMSGVVLLDREGEAFASIGDNAHLFVPLEEISQDVVNAVVAIEDARFWDHPGVDIISIGRAVLVNLREGRKAQGASTITQQLARNLFLTAEKSYSRKVQEAVYALLLERRFSKSQIMSLYLNHVYFGEGAYGIEEAARVYFGKPAAELSLSEGALLAGLLQAPSRYTPYRDLQGAQARRDIVLRRMHELGFIDETTRLSAQAEPVVLAQRRGGRAPYFVDYVHTWLSQRFDAATLLSGGLRVKTTLDLQVQRAAEEALGNRQGAVVVLDAASGAILAMVGGRDYRESQFNRAVYALRQPGSAFKPFVYAAALERGWQMNDLIEDVPRDFGGYAPTNFGDEYWGPITLKQGLVRSLNNGSVWLLREIGVNAAMEMARRLGITTLTPDDRHLALALGGLKQGVSPLEMAGAYLPFATGGVRHVPFAVMEVTDSSGRVLYRHRPLPRRVLSEEVAYFITDILQDAVRYGTGAAADIGRPQAGKTGTADDQRSAWFVGYTPELVASVYVGNDDGSPLPGGGGALAAPIWRRLMVQALRDRPPRPFSVPPHVVTGVAVDPFTGLLAGETCPHRELDSFVRGREPQRYSPCAWSRLFDSREPQPPTRPQHRSISGSDPETPPAEPIPKEDRPPFPFDVSPNSPRPGPILEHAFD